MKTPCDQFGLSSAPVELAGLNPLGPIAAAKWKNLTIGTSTPNSTPRWTVGGYDFLELSIRTETDPESSRDDSRTPSAPKDFHSRQIRSPRPAMFSPHSPKPTLHNSCDKDRRQCDGTRLRGCHRRSCSPATI